MSAQQDYIIVSNNSLSFITMSHGLVCWKCGKSIEDLPLPLGRLSECKACHAELHVCKLCEFYDPHVADQCREPVADFVKEKERANFCDYFKPRPNAYTTMTNSQSHAAKVGLNAMFGLESNDNNSESALSEAEKSRKKLDELFKK